MNRRIQKVINSYSNILALKKALSKTKQPNEIKLREKRIKSLKCKKFNFARCKSFPSKKLPNPTIKDKHCCYICGKISRLTKDHIIPKSLIKTKYKEISLLILSDSENFRTLCNKCNVKKGSKLDFDDPRTQKLLDKYDSLSTETFIKCVVYLKS